MRKLKQILAITAIVIIVGLFITTLILAVLGSALFQASLYAMIIIPIMLYIFLWLYKLIHGEDKAN